MYCVRHLRQKWAIFSYPSRSSNAISRASSLGVARQVGKLIDRFSFGIRMIQNLSGA
jgi:hypothetical protein